ncbi:radical SAM protein [Sphingomonas prati]|uniref:MoaA/NifB/PqqE/SkfB family radical SAM enzyme n=1 Tax=Sphingomonas prati TaxID=1843237 RepID=A0A7W9BUP3_9SPHN|nr:radical SAM protein [Sphingomonas prati]MBB5730361.1 MoaA/NifB/PqqE/SkfB family radical SAM enzyme [Sphingomonas prati]
MEGFIDIFDGGRIYGWAKRGDDGPVTVEILVDENVIETLVASNYREDLELSGRGSGKHAFASNDLSFLFQDDKTHAVDVRLRGSERRLVNGPVFVRDHKSISLKCFAPWTNLSVNYKGGAHVCPCLSLLKQPNLYLGDTNDSTILEIWNAPAVLRYREAFTKADYSATCREDVCPYLLGSQLPERPPTNVVRSIIGEGQLLDYSPEILTHDIDLGCNLECVMCRNKKVTINKLNVKNSTKQIDTLAKAGGLRKIITSGAGEALLFTDFVALLATRTLSDRDIEVHINSNLTTFNDKIWDIIKHNKLSFIASVDGATKETYEKIRKGARWNDVYRGLELIAEKYNGGELKKLIVSFVIMGANKSDIGGIIDICHDLSVPLTFTAQYGISSLEDNIFDCCDLEELDLVYEQFVEAGGFDLPRVHLGSAEILKNRAYRGIDFRLGKARYQTMNWSRYDLAERILRQAVEDVWRGRVECEAGKEAELLTALSDAVARRPARA